MLIELLKIGIAVAPVLSIFIITYDRLCRVEKRLDDTIDSLNKINYKIGD